VDIHEYEGTPVAAVARIWANYMTRVIEFNNLVRESLTILGPALEAGDLFAAITRSASEDQRRRSYNTTMHAKHEIDADFNTLNGHILMAAWGGFESFVDDFCRAALMMDKTLLATDHFKSVKVSPSIMLLGDEERAESILREAFNKDGADLKIGVGKFEAQLKFIALSDSVRRGATDELKERIFYAQQFRNLLAHKAGFADKRFIERCPALPYSAGDKVAISSEKLRRFLSALVVYGLLVVNEDRARRNLAPWKWPIITPDPALESPYKQDWGHIHPETGWYSPPLPLFSKLTI
jgi:hypothetical protein